MVLKQMLDMATQKMLFNNICLSEELKDKCIAIIQKQIIMKISFDDEKLTKLQCESEKNLVEWFWRVLVLVRLADSRQISNPEHFTLLNEKMAVT